MESIGRERWTSELPLVITWFRTAAEASSESRDSACPIRQVSAPRPICCSLLLTACCSGAEGGMSCLHDYYDYYDDGPLGCYCHPNSPVPYYCDPIVRFALHLILSGLGTRNIPAVTRTLPETLRLLRLSLAAAVAASPSSCRRIQDCSVSGVPGRYVPRFLLTGTVE